MSMEYCHEHDRYYDTGYEEMCPLCAECDHEAFFSDPLAYGCCPTCGMDVADMEPPNRW